MSTLIRKATLADIPQLEKLANSAYRGASSRKGWTHEADLIDGTIRTDAATLQSLIEDAHTVVLVYLVNDTIEGCVFLEKHDNAMHLGMLCVSPDLQAQGIGKKLLIASDDYARSQGCDTMEIHVIMSRTELIDWYRRYGYEDTGRRADFSTDSRYGVPRQALYFNVMDKKL